jgi:hypothetical protein
MNPHPSGASSRNPFRDLSAEDQLVIIETEDERSRLSWCCDDVKEAVEGLLSAIRMLERRGLGRQLATTRRRAESVVAAWEKLMAELPVEYGGEKPTRRVGCPTCKMTGGVERRVPVLRHEVCWRCNGEKTILRPAGDTLRIDLSEHRPRRLSRLQRSILLIALSASSKKKPSVPTKLIRKQLRERGVATTDAGFSRALARLEGRGLLHRRNRGRGRPPSRAKARTVAVSLTQAGKLATRALRENDQDSSRNG